MATSYGQIKVVDDSYKTETATISELNKTSYMEMFEKLFPRYKPCTYEIRDIDINAVGEKFYVYEESKKQFVRINPADSTVCITSMPVGYYEITNVFLTSDRLGECRDEVLKYKINQNERTSIIDRMSFSDPVVISNLISGGLGSDNILSVLARRTDIILPFYTCKDSNGKLFYISARDIKDYVTRFKYIMVSFYENVEKLLKGQKIALFNNRDYIIDYISNEPIKISLNYGKPILKKDLGLFYCQAEINPNVKFLQCKDIVLKEGLILAIIEYGQGNFAVPIYEIDNWENDSSTPELNVNRFWSSDGMKIVSEQELNNVVSNFNTVQNKLRASQLNAAQESAQASAQYKQKRLKNLTSKYGAEMASVIAEHKVKIGMTQEMCKEAWGRPYETYTTTTAAGSTQIWIYGYKTRLYFVNDRLNKIKN